MYKYLLCGNQKKHIQLFAAESFAFLIRKSKHRKDLLQLLFEHVTEEPLLCNGVGYLIFHSIKGIKMQFNFSAADILNISLNFFGNEVLQKEHVCIF